ncbi:MAG: PA2778 family cysteine peptidase [Wenzhouxiangella sp.]
MRLALLAGLIVSLTACATWRGPGPAEVLADLPEAVTLLDVPFYPQTEFDCGPAALATVLAYSGISVDYQALVDRVYLPARRGSLQAEMLAAARSQGRIAYRLPASSAAVFTELAYGRPVLVLENLGLNIYPVWHYAVVTGFEAGSNTLIQHSGQHETFQQPIRRWQRSWRRAGRWAVVLFEPGELPATDDPDGWVRAVADFEAGTSPQAARQAWSVTTERWPDQAMAWLGLGNAEAAMENYAASEQAFRQVLMLEPEYVTARFNLALLALRDQRPCEAATRLASLLNDDRIGDRAAEQLEQARSNCEGLGRL